MSRGALQELHRRSMYEKRTKIVFCTQSKKGSENRSSHFEPKITWISFSRGSGPPLIKIWNPRDIFFWKTIRPKSSNGPQGRASPFGFATHRQICKKSILLVVQYRGKYSKSCSEDFILQDLILRTRLCGTGFIAQPSWLFHFKTKKMLGRTCFVPLRRGWRQTMIVQFFGTKIDVGCRNDQILNFEVGLTALKFKS